MIVLRLRKAPSSRRGALLLVAALLALPTGAACRTAAALSNTHATPEDVARSLVRALARQDLVTLRATAVTESEFHDIVWPALPASQPERNIPWEYAWGDLHAKSDAHLRALVAGWQDRGHTVVAVQFLGATTDYDAFRVHRQTSVTLRDAAGTEMVMRLCGSLIEMNGRYKVFSYVVD